jgi:hypothetical protein
MTTHINGIAFAVQATEDLSQAKYKVGTLAGTIAQATDKRLGGVIVSNTSSGYNGSQIVSGITKAYIGAAVGTVGYPLKLANSGYLTPASSGDVSCGRNLQLANSGDITMVLFDSFNLNPCVV